MYNQICTLIKYYNTRDAYGNAIKTAIRQEVYCRPLSVRYSEFYQAAQVNMKPTLVLELADYYDYDDQTVVEFEDHLYDIIRSYRTDVSLQLTCSPKTGNKEGD